MENVYDAPRWIASVRILAGSDSLRQEQLTRSLRSELAALQDIELRTVPPPAAPAGSKGTLESVALMLAAAAPLAPSTADAVKAVLTSWLARDRRTVIRMKIGDRAIEITGDPSPEQQRALDRLLGLDGHPDR